MMAVSLGSFMLSLVYFTQAIDPHVMALQGPVTLLNVLVGLLVLWALVRGRSLRKAEYSAYLGLAFTTVVQVALLSAAPAPAGVYPNSGPYWAMVCVSATGFIILSLRSAWIMNGLLMLYCLVVPWVFHGPYAMQQPLNLLRIQISSLLVAMMLGTIASLRAQVDQQRVTQETLRRLAYSDSLTGVPNRRAVYPAIETLIQEADLNSPGAIFLLDLDYFKGINDQYGHSVGDEVLIAFAQLLSTCPAVQGHRPPTVGRWGGEEFIVILPGATPELSRQRAEQLVQKVHHSVWPQGIKLTISLGSTTVRPGDDFSLLLARADQSLYRAKALGRNRAVTAELDRPEDGLFTTLPLVSSWPA